MFEKNKTEFGKKGMQLSVSTFLFTAIVLGILLFVLYVVIFRFFDIKTEVQEADVNRHAFTFANILLSSDKIIYGDGTTVWRGVFDKTKLDSVQNNPTDLFDKLGYPASSTDVTIDDLDSGVKWTFHGSGPAATVDVQLTDKTFEVSFPVAIRFSESDIHVGKMTLKLTEKSLS